MFHDIDDNDIQAINNNQVPNVAQNLNLDANRVAGEFRRNEMADYLARQNQIIFILKIFQNPLGP